MSIVVCDLDAVSEAQSQLNALRQRLSDEANQHGSIQGQIEQRLRDIASDAAQEMLHHHSLDPHHLWDHHGLGWLSQATYDRHRAVEDMRGRLRWIIQQVQSAHGPEVGGLIGLQASDIDPKLGQLLAALWDAATTFNPGNLLWLARESWEIGNRLNTAGNWFSVSRGELDGFLNYLDQLWHREDRVVRALLTGLGANSGTLLFGAGGAAALTASEWLASPQAKQVLTDTTRFLAQHYRLHSEITSLADYLKDPYRAHAGGSIEGDLGHKERGFHRQFGFIQVDAKEKVAVGALSLTAAVAQWKLGSLGPKASADFKADLASASDSRSVSVFGVKFTRTDEVDVGDVEASGSADRIHGVSGSFEASALKLSRSFDLDIGSWHLLTVHGSLGILGIGEGFTIDKGVEAKVPISIYGIPTVVDTGIKFL